jgi:DNA invertase Pin-like site-specific DNA recombinase
MNIGYARVSTHNQNLDLQLDELKKAGCEKVYQEQVSGMKEKREELTKLKEQLRAGDIVVVWKLDRLGRSLKDLVQTVKDFEDMGVGLRSLTESIDTTSNTGKLIFHIFASLAEFERELIRERTFAGLSSARARGRIGGRPKKITPEKIIQMKAMHKDTKIEISEMCKTFGIARNTLYKYLELNAFKKPVKKLLNIML